MSAISALTIAPNAASGIGTVLINPQDVSSALQKTVVAVLGSNTGAFVGTSALEGSNDGGTTWVAVGSIAGPGINVIPHNAYGRYRINNTAYTSGSAAAWILKS